MQRARSTEFLRSFGFLVQSKGSPKRLAKVKNEVLTDLDTADPNGLLSSD